MITDRSKLIDDKSMRVDEALEEMTKFTMVKWKTMRTILIHFNFNRVQGYKLLSQDKK